MQDKELLSVTVVVDDETGMYSLGDMDYTIKSFCHEWLQRDIKNRESLADWLRKLAKNCENNEYPFATESKVSLTPLSKE